MDLVTSNYTFHGKVLKRMFPYTHTNTERVTQIRGQSDKLITAAKRPERYPQISFPLSQEKS